MLCTKFSSQFEVTALMAGCVRFIGFAGTDAKVEYLKSLGFDAAYNYKTTASLDAALKEACPNGVDMFFDNVCFDMQHVLFACGSLPAVDWSGLCTGF